MNSATPSYVTLFMVATFTDLRDEDTENLIYWSYVRVLISCIKNYTHTEIHTTCIHTYIYTYIHTYIQHACVHPTYTHIHRLNTRPTDSAAQSM
jgi:hypothetical protein